MMLELRMAWREARPAIKRFIFMIASVALGVGALTGIKGFSHALDRAMSRSARDLIAADILVRMSGAARPDELRIMGSLATKGAEMTQITETLSMVSALKTNEPLLSTVKAVDPARYPFFGAVELDPPAPLRSMLLDNTAVVSRELLVRTGTSVGDMIRIGRAQFRIASVLKSEPDRLIAGFELGPRLMITRNGLDKTQLMQFGSRASESYLFRLPGTLNLEEARRILKSGFQRPVRIHDYRDPNPSVSLGLQRMANFLSLIGLLALLVGGLGVATTVHTYLQQRYDSIAILKCLGGVSSQIIRIHLIQGLFIGIVGSILGLGLGFLVQWAFPPLLRGFIDLPTELDLSPGVAAQGFLIGTITTLLFLLPPLLAIRKVRPVRIFLRNMPQPRVGVWKRWRQDPLPAATIILLALGMGLLASWLAQSWTRGFGFLAGLTGAILALALTAQILLVGLRLLPRPTSLAIRHGLKNLWRPGNHTAAIVVALGIGVGFIITVYLIQTSLLSQIVKRAPSDYPNLILLGITEREKESLWQFLRTQPGILDAGKPIPAIPGRLQRVDGKTAEERNLEAGERRYSQIEFVLTWTDNLPADTKVVEGSWWRPSARAGLVSVAQHAARELKIGVGAGLEFDSGGKIIRGTVANIRDVDFSRPGTSNQFIFSPGSLDGVPASYVGTVRVSNAGVVPLQAALFARFPSVTSIEVGQVLIRVQQILDKIANIIRFVAFFAIIAGVIILASSVASTRYQRIREAALLKTLGATRSLIARIQATEFAILGSTAGLVGGLLASAAARYMLGHLLETEYEFRWAPLLAGTLAAAIISVATGWLASRGILKHRPLEILREN